LPDTTSGSSCACSFIIRFFSFFVVFLSINTHTHALLLLLSSPLGGRKYRKKKKKEKTNGTFFCVYWKKNLRFKLQAEIVDCVFSNSSIHRRHRSFQIVRVTSICLLILSTNKNAHTGRPARESCCCYLASSFIWNDDLLLLFWADLGSKLKDNILWYAFFSLYNYSTVVTKSSGYFGVRIVCLVFI
jgi:hypothetical protein